LFGLRRREFVILGRERDGIEAVGDLGDGCVPRGGVGHEPMPGMLQRQRSGRLKLGFRRCQQNGEPGAAQCRDVVHVAEQGSG
jgi:hypothetical protein